LLGIFFVGVAQAQNSVSQDQAHNLSSPAQTLRLAQQDGPSAVQAPPETPAASSSSPAEKETTLPTVTVTGQSERDTRTEYTGGYTPQATTLVTKLPLSLRETPQTVTVITRQQMDDFGLNTVTEVLQNTSTVNVIRAGTSNLYYSRGFAMQVGYDDMANPSVLGLGLSGASPDSAFFDHVEIQQGAAGLLTGAGEPGGTINMIRKRPTETFQGQVEAELGSWDRRRLVGDLSGPLTQSGALRGRVVLVSEDSDSYVDYSFSDKKALYGVIEARPTASTKIGASLQYQKNRFNHSLGYPTAPDGSDLGWSRSTYFGTPDGWKREETTRTTLYLEQRFLEDWVFKANYTHSVDKWDVIYASQWGTPNVATGDGMSAWAVNQRDKTVGNALEMFAQGTGLLFGRRHEFALGANGSESKGWGVSADGPDIPFNIYTEHDKGPYMNVHLTYDDPDKTRQYGVFGVARLNIADSLKVILGARVSWYAYWNPAGEKTMDEKAVFSPYAGIIYDLNERFSVYASYSDIFKPQTAKDRSGSVLEPVVGANYEAGIKGEFFNKRLNAAAAIFRLEQTNRAETDDDFGVSPICDNWYCSYASGKVISEGVDLSLNGALSPNWNVGASYTYLKSEYATGEQKGDRYETRNPQHAFRLSSTYRIPATNWMVGGSLRAQSETHRTTIKQSGFSLLDLMARYQINKQAEVSFNASNVFDRKYRSPNLHNGTYYGEPRRLALNLKYFF
jgi:outer membrane receptor for ferric coprogen and ferric-rhodotorulic acid